MATEFPLWVVCIVAGVVMATSYGWGRVNSRRALRWQYEQGYNAGQVDRNELIEHRLSEGWRLEVRPSTGMPVWVRPGLEDFPPDNSGNLELSPAGEQLAPAPVPYEPHGGPAAWRGLPTQGAYREALAAIVAGCRNPDGPHPECAAELAPGEPCDCLTAPGPEPEPEPGCPVCAGRLLLNSGPHCPGCGWQSDEHKQHSATLTSLPGPYRPRHGAPHPLAAVWALGPAEPGPADDSRGMVSGPGPGEARQTGEYITVTPSPEMRAAVLAAAELDVSYAADPAELTPLAELDGPGGLARLEQQIDAYLADRSNTDVWQLRIEAERRAWCLSVGLAWQPIEWAG